MELNQEGECLETELKDLQRRIKELEAALQRKEIALKELMGQIDIEKQSVRDEILANVDHLLMPSVKKLQKMANGFDEKHLNLLEKNLNELTASFGSHIEKKLSQLTPREIEICNMIKGGLTIKEIAEMLHVSSRTIETHRNNIRKKLGLCNQKVNLVVYLKSL